MTARPALGQHHWVHGVVLDPVEASIVQVRWFRGIVAGHDDKAAHPGSLILAGRSVPTRQQWWLLHRREALLRVLAADQEADSKSPADGTVRAVPGNTDEFPRPWRDFPLRSGEVVGAIDCPSSSVGRVEVDAEFQHSELPLWRIGDACTRRGVAPLFHLCFDADDSHRDCQRVVDLEREQRRPDVVCLPPTPGLSQESVRLDDPVLVQ